MEGTPGPNDLGDIIRLGAFVDRNGQGPSQAVWRDDVDLHQDAPQLPQRDVRRSRDVA